MRPSESSFYALQFGSSQSPETRTVIVTAWLKHYKAQPALEAPDWVVNMNSLESDVHQKVLKNQSCPGSLLDHIVVVVFV